MQPDRPTTPGRQVSLAGSSLACGDPVHLDGTKPASAALSGTINMKRRRFSMGRGILLWLLGVPIPVIILILLFWH
jgi:hypothetical protein